MKSNVTLKQVADAAGCSPMVVSVIFRPSGSNVRVGEATRERVLKVARELGYRHNELARAVVTGRSQMIGLLSRTFETEMQMHILCGVREVAAEKGYLLKLLQVPDDDAGAQEVAAQCAEQRLAGVVAINLSQPVLDYLRRETANYNIPVALLDDVPDQDWAVSVDCDDELGICAAVDHLCELGHTRFALMSGPDDSPNARRREATFLRVIESRGFEVAPENIRRGDWWAPEVNEPIVRELMRLRPRPTALLCASDWGAMAALRAIRAEGLNVPNDVSVVGFGDQGFSHFADPPLTSIHQPFNEMGQRAMRSLLEIIDAPDPKKELKDVAQHSIALPTSLMYRASTAICPPSRERLVRSVVTRSLKTAKATAEESR